MKNWIVGILVSLLVATGISGCAGIVVGGAATGAAVAHDRRTAGTMLEDQSIEFKAKGVIRSDEDLRAKAHINVVSVNNVVLLSGETPTTALKNRAGELVSRVEKVRSVHNELRIAQPTRFKSRGSDTLITGKVKTKILTTRKEAGVDSTHVKVVTENKVVYLMGLVTRREGKAATNAARQVGNVRRVVQLFEYID